ncbi:AAA family ATPase [Corynebacterium sp. SCR221107]|uniref:AAA family ATPase n=1 Tax=Corynebacterium sp. SCR221107 TaxID=3017361 RepID=UPI0022EC636C|nr:AAA family ATPase [Corynebacterium sp. SCR221107]WBT08989.1 AAA family ATPase [Corynebacterium sp. SCR221107]
MIWKELERGKRASFQTPNHSAEDRGTSVTYTGDSILVHTFNADKGDVLDALGLTYADLYDQPRTTYTYPDGRSVTRFFTKEGKKTFTQAGNKKGTALYGQDTLNRWPNTTVLVVEGEKDVNTAVNVLGVPAVSQAQGASTPPSKADWAPLAGRDVIIVQDADTPGMTRAAKVKNHLQAMSTPPASISVMAAKVGNDFSDHVAAGYGLDELVEVEPTVGRRHIVLTPACSVKTEKVDWLVDQWIPRNMLTLLAGREGIGKSTIACSWVAEFTRRGMNAAYLNTEDSRSFTVKPRLQAAGADLNRLFFVDVQTAEGTEGHLKLPQDTTLLFEALAAKGVEFVVLDAAKSAMDSKLDGYKDDHVRQFLEPLAAAADKHKITVLGLAHFGKAEGKDTGRLLLGSIAWSQIARSVISAAVDDDGNLIVSNTKANLATGIVSRRAHIESRPVQLYDGDLTNVGALVWGDFTDEVATEFLDRQGGEEQGSKTETELWLHDYLTERGACPRQTIVTAAKKVGIAERSLARAFKKLGGVSSVSGFPRVATWALPTPATVVPLDSHRNHTSGTTGTTGTDLQKQAQKTLDFSSYATPQECGTTGGTTVATLTHGTTGTTGTTGTDLQKHSGTTGDGEKGSGTTGGHPHNQHNGWETNTPTTPTVSPIPHPREEEVKHALVDSTSTEVGLSERVLLGCVPTKTADQDTVRTILAALVEDGALIYRNEKYFRP